MIRKILAVTVLLLVLAPLPVLAENDQTVVIGWGLGGYDAPADDVRGDRKLLASHAYVEWYALDELGFGFRRTVLIETGIAFLALGAFETFSLTTNMVTVNWVPFGAQRYARLGLVAGVGTADYKYDGVFFLLGGATRQAHTSGTATLAGAYLDWGGDGFGARLGYDMISTNLDNVTVSGSSLKADGSGNSIYFDLRWAF
ncbi:MAG TPA: hypothetical protein VKB51_16025 [bacterium]|nr:hypothetical protein [bacterium]